MPGTRWLAWHDVAAGTRLARRVPGLVRHPLSPEEARHQLARRLAEREAGFLALARAAVFAAESSPYRPLLRHAGCEYGDLERLVTRDGLEAALRALYRAGVYLACDEFRGLRPVVRGSTTLGVDPDRLRNSTAVACLPAQSSASRGLPRLSVTVDLVSVREYGSALCLFLDAIGPPPAVHAVWGVPGGASLSQLLQLAVAGHPPARWFVQVDPKAPGLHPRYRWSARTMRWASLMSGVPLPAPRHVPVEDPRPIVEWLAEVVGSGRVPHLRAFASSAVRLCQTARAAGVDLRGTRITVSGEPVTRARMAAIREAGAWAVPLCGATEAGTIGYGCLRPEMPDDLHVLTDMLAVIETGAGQPEAGVAPGLLLLTSLRPAARLVLLNVSLGDSGILGPSRCGCPLEALGWATRLHTIRSGARLTAGGMGFPHVELERILEEVLPARFGGVVTDYQLIEEEAEDGRARLRLLVHPRLGTVNARAVAETFLGAVARDRGIDRITSLAWRDADVLRLERRAPEASAGGKVRPFRERPSSP